MLLHCFKIYLLEDFVPTPFVAFGIKQLGCAGRWYLHNYALQLWTHFLTFESWQYHTAGIMVTASHNPMQDNGFKVYWSNGSQIVPPHDEGIAASIAENLQPWQSYNISDEAVLNHSLASNVTSIVADAYFEAISRLSQRKSRPTPSDAPVRAVYTGDA